MIRVVKSLNIPESLSTRNNYNGEDVKKQLYADHYGKCYLCERKVSTGFHIEHLRSRTNNPTMICNWENLYLSCTYCNGRKSANYDNILNPSTSNIEEQIYHLLDYPHSRAIFRATEEPTREITDTISLLTKLFNVEEGEIKGIMWEIFFKEVVSVINSFQQMVLQWLTTREPTAKEEREAAIKEELDIRKEFLGFKYWIIKTNPILEATFGSYIQWNKV